MMLGTKITRMHRGLGILSNVRAGTRSITSVQKAARLAELRKVYKPFAQLNENSPEYLELARSGKVWEDYFQPFDTQPYKAVQQVG